MQHAFCHAIFPSHLRVHMAQNRLRVSSPAKFLKRRHPPDVRSPVYVPSHPPPLLLHSRKSGTRDSVAPKAPRSHWPNFLFRHPVANRVQSRDPLRHLFPLTSRISTFAAGYFGANKPLATIPGIRITGSKPGGASTRSDRAISSPGMPRGAESRQILSTVQIPRT